jgi:hypothetical protein
MSDKSSKPAKSDLMKMLADAVLNTPGAKRVEPLDHPSEPPMPKKGGEEVRGQRQRRSKQRR